MCAHAVNTHLLLNMLITVHDTKYVLIMSYQTLPETSVRMEAFTPMKM